MTQSCLSLLAKQLARRLSQEGQLPAPGCSTSQARGPPCVHRWVASAIIERTPDCSVRGRSLVQGLLAPEGRSDALAKLAWKTYCASGWAAAQAGGHWEQVHPGELPLIRAGPPAAGTAARRFLPVSTFEALNRSASEDGGVRSAISPLPAGWPIQPGWRRLASQLMRPGFGWWVPGGSVPARVGPSGGVTI